MIMGFSIINLHCPHKERPDDEKEVFYEKLKHVYDGCSSRTGPENVNRLLGNVP